MNIILNYIHVVVVKNSNPYLYLKNSHSDNHHSLAMIVGKEIHWYFDYFISIRMSNVIEIRHQEIVDKNTTAEHCAFKSVRHIVRENWYLLKQ